MWNPFKQMSPPPATQEKDTLSEGDVIWIRFGWEIKKATIISITPQYSESIVQYKISGVGLQSAETLTKFKTRIVGYKGERGY